MILRRTLIDPVLFLCLLAGVSHSNADLPEVVQRVKPSVVAVGTFQKTRSPAFAFLGTGFAVDDGTLIATNAHVVSAKLKPEGGETLAVLVHGRGAQAPGVREAKIVALDEAHDLALLRIVGAPLPAVTLGDSDSVREGRSIAFTGFPIGQVLGFHAVTHRGIVSSLAPVALPAMNSGQLDARAVERLKAPPITLFQLDATVYSGSSGSPLYDEASGEVLGIVNLGFLRNMKDPPESQPRNISFAVPARFLRELMAKSR